MTDQTPDLMTAEDLKIVRNGRIGALTSERIINTFLALADKTARYDEIHREWESACERERTANHLLADKTKECEEERRKWLAELSFSKRLTARLAQADQCLQQAKDDRDRIDAIILGEWKIEHFSICDSYDNVTETWEIVGDFKKCIGYGESLRAALDTAMTKETP